jgi:hypothetical protein
MAASGICEAILLALECDGCNLASAPELVRTDCGADVLRELGFRTAY